MIVTKPTYYDAFRCIAGSCPDSCCKEWGVWVDEASAEYYRALPGPLGDRLREVLVEEEGGTVMQIVDGRCPMWRADGLCRIQAELGEEALCRVCTDFPRIRHDYGDFLEHQLELSCPEAARLILSSPVEDPIRWEEPGGEEPTYDPAEMAAMADLRGTLLNIMADPARSEAQAFLDCLETVFGPFEAQEEPDLPAIVAVFRDLEMLTELWPRKLREAAARPLDPKVRPLAAYLLRRYWFQEIGLGLPDAEGKLGFVIAACLLVNALPGDFTENAQLFSKEIENSDCNPETLIVTGFTPEELSALLRS